MEFDVKVQNIFNIHISSNESPRKKEEEEPEPSPGTVAAANLSRFLTTKAAFTNGIGKRYHRPRRSFPSPLLTVCPASVCFPVGRMPCTCSCKADSIGQPQFYRRPFWHLQPEPTRHFSHEASLREITLRKASRGGSGPGAST